MGRVTLIKAPGSAERTSKDRHAFAQAGQSYPWGTANVDILKFLGRKAATVVTDS